MLIVGWQFFFTRLPNIIIYSYHSLYSQPLWLRLYVLAKYVRNYSYGYVSQGMTDLPIKPINRFYLNIYILRKSTPMKYLPLFFEINSCSCGQGSAL